MLSAQDTVAQSLGMRSLAALGRTLPGFASSQLRVSTHLHEANLELSSDSSRLYACILVSSNDATFWLGKTMSAACSFQVV